MKSKYLLAIAVAGLATAGAARADDGMFDSNGVKIHYVTAGEGETVVLIHGWMSDATMWGRDASGNAKLDASSTAGFRFVALDCRGHGKSDKPHDTAQYGAEMAADVVRLLDHLKVKKAHLIGYSMGAFIAGKLVATHPDRVLSVVYGGQAPLIAGPSWTDANEVAAFAKAADEGKGMGAYLLSVMPPDKPKLTLEQANKVADFLMKGKDVKALAAAGCSFKDLRVSAESLTKSKVPALFLHGENESDAVKGSIAKARKILSQSQVKVIEGGDHITTIGKREFGVALIEFLQANKAAQARLGEGFRRQS